MPQNIIPSFIPLKGAYSKGEKIAGISGFFVDFVSITSQRNFLNAGKHFAFDDKENAVVILLWSIFP
jgi:hypothetical protein